MNINCILIHEFIILIINKRILKIELTTRQNLIHESRHSISYSFSSVYFSFRLYNPYTISYFISIYIRNNFAFEEERSTHGRGITARGRTCFFEMTDRTEATCNDVF